MSKLTHATKEQIVNYVWVNGTLESATSEGVTMEMIQAEMKKSAVFKRRIRKALEESKGMLIDEARGLVRDYMRGKFDKTDRNRLTAAIALLNAYEPGFKGATTVKGTIDHNVRVITGVPRPDYIDSPSVKVLEAPKHKTVKTKVLDDKGNLLAIKSETVEDVIGGEVINDN